LASKGVKNAAKAAVTLSVKAGNAKADGTLTEQGKKRQAMGNAGRAKDRAAKYSGHKPSEFKYNAKTNLATLKRK
jgi:hypothetical protein